MDNAKWQEKKTAIRERMLALEAIQTAKIKYETKQKAAQDEYLAEIEKQNKIIKQAEIKLSKLPKSNFSKKSELHQNAN